MEDACLLLPLRLVLIPLPCALRVAVISGAVAGGSAGSQLMAGVANGGRGMQGRGDFSKIAGRLGWQGGMECWGGGVGG